MSKQVCANPIDPGTLADYWAAALLESEERLVEEHLLSCDDCGDRLREITALTEAIRKIAREGTLNVVVSQAFLDRAAREGMRVREYAPPAGGSVNCTVTSKDDLLVAHLAADFAVAPRIDLRYSDPRGTTRVHDLPVDRNSGEVILNVAIDKMRQAPRHVATIQLIAVEETGDRILGEYTFHHTPSPE